MRRVVRNATLSAVLAISLGVITPAAAAPPTTPATPDSPEQSNPSGDSHVVTLLTGDKIRVERDADGHSRATVERSAPDTTTYAMVPADDALYVIPDTAFAPIAAGTIDRRLFDVAGLVDQGYDDESVDELPVIVQRDQGISLQAAPDFTAAGARPAATLPVVNATALEVTKEHAVDFWSAAVTGPHLTGGVDHIWLDAAVRGTLDRSVPQIGGDVAHERGLDGAGVTVAVIDSGIDTSHPDLADQVVASHNFTDEPDADDHVGHGTHVASIVAGTGAASDGKYAGVAPGADLINAKALELAIVDPGIPVATGRESWIIAAMQWAVDQGADIVNMSLGNAAPDGNDPLSVALNDLTQSSGTLFVVAAGNSGNGGIHYTIESPATADSALAVGSVNRDESVSFFSSLGPRMIDGAIKPEITAPGDQIVAARAANARIGRPAEDGYASMSGTSMAAPHVAGSAALLLQRHPDWTWQQLRAGLVSTAAFNPDYLVYDQGGGRVDIDRATAQDVRVDVGTVNMGYFRAETPEGDKHASQSVTYHNDGDSPVDLTLTATPATHQSGAEAEPGTITVEPGTLRVPAGGSATATISVNAVDREPGAYSGRVLASGPDGLELGTPVGFFKQNPDLVDYTFRAVDRRGDPAEGFLILRNPRIPFAFSVIAIPRGGTSTMRLELGDYSYLGYIATPDASGRFNAAVSLVADPEFEAEQPNRTITLDARDAQPMSVRVPRDVDVDGLTVGLEISRPELGDETIQDSFIFVRSPLSGGALPNVPLSVIPFDPPQRGHGDLDTFWSLVEPRLRASVISPHRFSLDATLMGFTSPDGEQRLTVVDAGTGTPEDLAGKDLTGKIALLNESPDLSFTDQTDAVAAAGAVAAIIASTQPGLFFGQSFTEIPVLAVPREDGDRIRDLLGGHRPVTVKLTGSPVASYQYDLALREHDRVRRDTTYRFGVRDLAQLNVDYYAAAHDPATRFVVRRFPDFESVCGYCGLTARAMQDWNGPARHTEYVSPGVLWDENVLQDGQVRWLAERSYDPGSTHVSWGQAPVAPGVPIEAGLRSTRVGDTLSLRLSGLTHGGEPTHWTQSDLLFERTTELTRNGEPLGECAQPWMLQCDVDVPADDSTYTLTATMPDIDWSSAVPPSTTTWTFHSGHVDGDDPEMLPLIDLDYEVPVTLDNTARAGAPTIMLIRARHQPGDPAPSVNSLSMRFSGDGGEHWKNALVWRIGPDRYVVLYQNPRMNDSNGSVAIQVTAKDRDGNSIDQTVMRAYDLTTR